MEKIKEELKGIVLKAFKGITLTVEDAIEIKDIIANILKVKEETTLGR